MLRKFFFSPLLLLTIGILCWSTPIFAHDAFYPHHREDFESMTRRRELRGTVILSTAVFLCVLGAVVYVALRKIKEIDDADRSEAKAVQERLDDAVNRAAHTARDVLNSGEDIAKAAETALITYAEAAGLTWQSRSYGHSRSESVPYHIRCKIGTDIITLNITADVVQLKAECSSQGTPKRASVVLRIADEEKAEGVSCGE